VTPDGFVAEGAYSSLIVWPTGGGEMWVVDQGIPRIPSVTELLVADIARSEGIAVMEKKMRPGELGNHAVWVVSALHGIREATSWVDGPLLARDGERARVWTGLLLSRQVPVDMSR
jgi:branched-subunit amino acid aminotransferase/4-amino-4-deoxychorismate lyase